MTKIWNNNFWSPFLITTLKWEAQPVKKNEINNSRTPAGRLRQDLDEYLNVAVIY